MKRRLLLAAPAALAVPAWAQGDALDRPPEPGPPPALAWPAIDEFTLANGLRVVVAARHKVPLVSVSLLLQAGRETDPAGQAGAAALLATLLTKGARRQGRAEGALRIARAAEALGGTLDAAAAWRHASLSMTVTAPRCAAALALLADCARAPLLQAAEFERARSQALDALRVAFANPGEVAQMAARRAFWGDVPPGWSPTPATLARVTPDTVRRLHARFVRPDRAILVLAGAVDAAEARTLAERHFAAWARPAAPPPALPRARPQPIDAAGVLVDLPGSGQSSVVIAAPFVAGASSERARADVANVVLGGGYSSRLNQEVRIQRGLSYGVAAFGEPQAEAGAWFASAQTQHASAAAVLQLMQAEVQRLARAAPGAAELDARRATLIGNLVRRLQGTGGLAQFVGAQLVQGRAPAALAQQVDELLAVTPEQVRDFAERHWAAGALRFAVAGDLAAAGAALADAAPGALRRRADALDFGAAF